MRPSRPVARFLAPSLAGALVSAAFALQATDPAAPQRPVPPTAPARPSVPPVAPEVAAIKAEFDEMARYLGRKNAVSVDDRGPLKALAAKLAPFAAARDPNALAMQVQVGTWLEDHTLVDSSYLTILELNPNNDIALAQWMNALNRRLEYDRSLEESLARGPIVAASTRVSLAAVDALLGLNRVGEAKVRMDAISFPANERPDVTGRYNTLKVRVDTLFPLWQQEDTLRQTETAANTLPRVELTTAKGPIVIELFEEQAPNSTAAFLEFVGSGLYTGTTFHKRVPGLGLLGGDPNSKPVAEGAAKPRVGVGSPGFRIADENGDPAKRRLALSFTVGFAKAEAAKTNPPTPTATARTLPNSAGSTFFILTSPAEHLNEEFTVVGRIVDGFETVLKLAPGDAITAATIQRKREHEYVVQKLPDLKAPTELTVLNAAPRPGTAMTPVNPGNAPPKIPNAPAPR